VDVIEDELFLLLHLWQRKKSCEKSEKKTRERG
jgi:hypothetical protein